MLTPRWWSRLWAKELSSRSDDEEQLRDGHGATDQEPSCHPSSCGETRSSSTGGGSGVDVEIKTLFFEGLTCPVLAADSSLGGSEIKRSPLNLFHAITNNCGASDVYKTECLTLAISWKWEKHIRRILLRVLFMQILGIAMDMLGSLAAIQVLSGAILAIASMMLSLHTARDALTTRSPPPSKYDRFQ